MKRYLKRIYHIVLAFVSGMITLIIIQSVLNVASTRKGSYGGELLIIPLFIILVVVGFDCGRAYFKEVDARKIAKRGFSEGYRIGTLKTIEEFLSENK